tara:strand:- start:455 stop:607 length:153 start_codon:yes stop_codon:yes gene_type:complete
MKNEYGYFGSMKPRINLDKEAKELQKKISKYYKLDKLITKLVKKNGTTKY